MQSRIVARAAVYDPELDMILLVRNQDADFWYIPGGGWECERENILECAAREVKEETGLAVTVGKLLYLQEYHDSPELVVFEPIFLATVQGSAVLDEEHEDADGSVGEARWFTRDELAELMVFPEVFKGAFWDDIADLRSGKDRFLGVNYNVKPSAV